MYHITGDKSLAHGLGLGALVAHAGYMWGGRKAWHAHWDVDLSHRAALVVPSS